MTLFDQAEQKKEPFSERLRRLRDRYRIQIAAAFAILATLALLAGEIFPTVNTFIFHSGVLQYVTLLAVLDLSVSVYRSQLPPKIRPAENQDESMPQLIEAVSHCRSDGADLLEYAGATTLPLIRAIKREMVPIRLLVKHPETIQGLQKHRMIATLDTLFNSVFSSTYLGKYEIRCYRAPFTLRGRKLGSEVLEIGWLTPDIKNQTAYGHANPSIIVDLSTKKNEYLKEFFERTFSDLWCAEDTEDGRVVLERLQRELLGVEEKEKNIEPTSGHTTTIEKKSDAAASRH